MLQGGLSQPSPPGQFAKHRLSFRSRLAVTGREEAVAGLDEKLIAHALGIEARPAELQQQPRPLGVVSRPEVERGRVPVVSGNEGVEVQCPVARFTTGPAGSVGQSGGLLPGRAGELKCGLPVVGQQLGAVGWGVRPLGQVAGQPKSPPEQRGGALLVVLLDGGQPESGQGPAPCDGCDQRFKRP